MYRFAIALCATLLLFLQPVYGAAIGVAMASGSFSVDNNMVVGNATLFDGSTLETATASSDLELAGGIRVRLAAGSRGRVFGDRLVLEKGVGELESGTGYRVEALGLRVLAEAAGSSGRVALAAGGKLQAVALAGKLRVTTGDGTVVAFLTPGAALEFQPQAVTGVQAPFQMTGCVERRGARIVLRDPLTGVSEEARGEQIENEIGRMVEVTATVVPGLKPVEGALEVIQVSRLRRVAGACPAPAPAAVPPAAKPSAGPAKPTAPPTTAPPKLPPAQQPGMSGTKKAVIAGVVVGGAAAGAVVYLTTRSNDNKGTISR